MVDSGASTVIGESILISGNLEGDEDLTVLGRVEGSIKLTRTVMIEESGVVKADLTVRNAIVSGVVVGNITASDSVEITEAGRMVGDIRAPRVIIVDGARFRGAVDMGDMEAPRASGPLPARTVAPVKQALARTSATPRPAATAVPARRPAPPTVPATTVRRESAPSVTKPDAAPPKAAPVVATKKFKKKVVVKKKG